MKRSLLLFFLLLAGMSACQLIPGQLTPSPLPKPPTSTSDPIVIRVSPSPTVAKSSTPTLPTPSPAPAGPLLLISKAISDSSNQPPYNFKVHYPQFSDATSPGLKAFNQVAEQIANDLMASYQQNIKNSPVTPDPNFGSSFMEAKYQVINGTQGLLSILYTVSDYSAGAAHPNSYSFVLNFNLAQGKKIELKDIFLPGSNFLQVISDFCVADLKQRDRLEFPEGALPQEDNYQNWNFNEQGLLISFDPYQVGPYAMGPSQVSIPYSALRTVVNPSGPLAIFTK